MCGHVCATEWGALEYLEYNTYGRTYYVQYCDGLEDPFFHSLPSRHNMLFPFALFVLLVYTFTLHLQRAYTLILTYIE